MANDSRVVVGRCGFCGHQVVSDVNRFGEWSALPFAQAQCAGCGAIPLPMRMAERRPAPRVAKK